MPPDTHSPWIFCRDEVDLLEEDIDEIYDVYQSQDGKVKTMEQAVMREQLDTEEWAEKEFALHMDFKWLMNKESGKSKEDDVEDVLFCDTTRPVFYEQVFRYIERVFAYATDLHARGGDTREHAFRIRINAKMVPIKCAVATSEESYGDPKSQAMAKKEYQLALVYLDRILLSLAFLAAEGDACAYAFLAPGTHMRRTLQQCVNRLSDHRHGFSSLLDSP